ncbi:MAG: prolipoprotein diacylglyceryl transferase [Clostridia bacterium]|nr:prolipoprotein diacylglyceryl transferase [Clostridia bacterium]
MHPQPLFTIGSLEIYAYGICMAVGLLACFGFLLFTMWKKKFNEEASTKILVIGVFATAFGIFMALLVQSIYNYIANPAEGFHLGGMTFLGGLIGGVVGFLTVYLLYIYIIAPHCDKVDLTALENDKSGSSLVKTGRKIRISLVKGLKNNMNATLTDAMPFIPIAICIAHAFGRLGCFFGGCCYGRVTDAWYGIACAAPNGYTLAEKVVPTQLFEMIFLLVLAGVMALLYFKFKLNYNFGVYAVGYGIWRFIIEFFRDDDRGGVVGAALTPSQILSIVMVVLGVAFFFLQYYVLSKHMKHPELQQEEIKAEAPAESAQGEI